MDVIDHELKRYDQTKSDLDMRKNPDNKEKEKEKENTNENVDNTLMNEEKPKDVSKLSSVEGIFLINFKFADGTTASPNSGIETASKVW